MDLLLKHHVQWLMDAWENDDSMESRVVRYGLREAARGPDAVLALCAGAIGTERLRYEKRFSYLATVGSNAPFIGLFGTVIGVILAFDQLQAASGGGGPSTAVMGVIAEALIATGIGLLGAIPDIIFFNLLKQRVAKTVSHTKLLAQSAAAFLRDQAYKTQRPHSLDPSKGSKDAWWIGRRRRRKCHRGDQYDPVYRYLTGFAHYLLGHKLDHRTRNHRGTIASGRKRRRSSAIDRRNYRHKRWRDLLEW